LHGEYDRVADERAQERERADQDERRWLDRAADEVASWFGDEEAERRRRVDLKDDYRSYGDGRWPEAGRNGRGTRGGGWSEVRVSDVMTRDVVTVRPDDYAEHAARLMREFDCGAIPVVDRSGRLVGMLTDRDITVRLVARGMDIRRARVGDCMTERAFACHQDEAVEGCVREMARRQVRRIPIVDDRDRVVGIISQSDLARHAGGHHGRGERREMADMLSAVSEPSRRIYR
jgi:CBS domain-containing protein